MAIDSISGGFQAAIAFDLPSVRRFTNAAAGGVSADAPTTPAKAASPPSTQDSSSKSRELETQRNVEKLKAIEQGVIAHEMAHKGVGGAYAGAVSYTYIKGPDGKRYITGGEVSIDISAAGSPEATVRKMRQVIGAALAPVDPSAQDYRVASQAQALQLEAQREVAAEAYAMAGVKTDEAPPSASLSLYA